MTIDKNILLILENLIPFPTFVLDDEGRIIDFNQQGKNFLPDATFNTLIYEILDKEFADALEKLLEECKASENSVRENIVTNNNQENVEYGLTIAPYKSESQNLFICTIRKVNEDQTSKDLQRFTIATEDIEKVLHNKNLFEIIDSVKSAFPFTYIGKAKIQKQIDLLDDFFWIKDSNRRFIIVNQRFAKILGVKTKQLEGRFEKDVLPHFQNKLFATIDSYILETTNAVVIDGVSVTSPYGNKPYEIVEFPILDIDNNVVAIFGVSQLSENRSSENETSQTNLVELLKIVGVQFIVSDESGIVQDYSSNVNIYFYDSEEIEGKSFLELLKESELQKRIKDFLNDKKSVKLTTKLSEKTELIGIKNHEQKNNILFVFNDSNKSDFKTSGIIKMYDTLMKISPEAMFIYDLENLKFMEVNEAATKLYGYSREEFLNMDLTDLYAPEDIQTLLESANKKLTSNEFTGPWRQMKKDGSSLIVELSKSALDFRGKSAHINVIRDITEEIKNSKKIKMFRTAFENSSDLIFVTDTDGYITYASESAIKNLGYSKHDLDRKPFLSLLVDNKRAEFNKEIIHGEIKENKKLKTELKNSAGDSVECNLAATPIYDYTGERESITLLAKLKPKPAKVEKGDSKVSDTNGIEPSFLSDVFHELLTPINVILGFIREISDSLEKPTDEQQEAIDIIDENQKVLLQTMDTAAEYSALEDNRIQFKPEEITFVDLLDEIRTTTDRTARTNDLELTYGKISSSLSLTTDKHHFSIFVTQFIKYAMQITEENKIYLSAYTYDNNKCLVSVKDRREGLTEKLQLGLEEIFTKDEDTLRKSFGFSRITTKLFRKLLVLLDARNEILKRDGSPIEYGIVFPSVLEIEKDEKLEDEFAETEAREREERLMNEIEETEETRKEEPIEEQQPEEMTVEEPAEVEDESVEVSKSDSKEIESEEPIQVQSQPEKPKQPTEEPAKPKTSSEKKSLQLNGLTCIYVEDQVDSQILFKVQMKDLKDIDFAPSFEEALPKIKSKQYDFIVMDINLEGEYNGIDALRVIQKLPGYHHTPIIAVTAYVLPGDRDKFIAAGFSDFISKPILKDKLVTILKNIF